MQKLSQEQRQRNADRVAWFLQWCEAVELQEDITAAEKAMEELKGLGVHVSRVKEDVTVMVDRLERGLINNYTTVIQDAILKKQHEASQQVQHDTALLLKLVGLEFDWSHCPQRFDAWAQVELESYPAVRDLVLEVYERYRKLEDNLSYQADVLHGWNDLLSRETK
jgi:hypothetical protein